MTTGKRTELPFEGMVSRFNSLSYRKAGIVILALYIISVTVVAIFHEPWLDEAQAWLIARDASYSDMLFRLPHIEGHVPLWWLILSIPAKLGVPYEIGLKTVNILISSGACALLLFRSPFPNAFKVLFPFTYFFFYQYAVIARPYMLVTFALFLTADLFRQREKKPVRFLLALILLCLADTFGIAIAGGIAAGWVISVIRKGIRGSSRQIICLAVLLIFAVILMIGIWPNGNADGFEEVSGKPVITTFLLELFMVPSEVVLTSMTAYGPDAITSLTAVQLIITAAVSIVIWIAMAYFFVRRDILPDMVLPVITLMILGALYIYLHHFGLFLMTGVYAAWISLASKSPDKDTKRHNDILRWIGGAFCAASLVTGLIWTGFSSANDIGHPYWISRDLYEWIEENSLEDRKWFAVWDASLNSDGSGIAEQNTASTSQAIPVNPYLKGPDPINFNNEGVSYAYFASNTDAQNEADISKWKKLGEPDLILCNDTAIADLLMNEMGYRSTYDMAYIRESRTSWKNSFTKGGVMVLVRRDSGIGYRAELSDLQSITGQG